MIKNIESFQGLNITFNTNEDCNLACKYAVCEGSKVLMADLSEKNIEDVKKGDMIIGFDEENVPHKFRRMHYAEVLDGGFTEEVPYYYLFKTKDKTLGLSAPHPLLNQWNKFVTAEEFYNSPEVDKKVYVDSIPRKKDINFTIENSCLYSQEDVVIGKIYEKKRVYNLTTSTRTFIANGILVHNCYELNKKPRVLSLDYAKKFIDLILTDPDPIAAIGTKDEWMLKRGLIIDFIGGDSFMHVDLMDAILNYYVYRVNTIAPNHKWANNWRISISSNGTLFANKECQDFIHKWKEVLSLGISVDGCPAIHDANRIFALRGPNGKEVGSMATIRKWWPWLRKINPAIVQSTKATCSKSSIPYLFESLQYMHEKLGITYINQNFIMEPTGCTEEDYIELEKQLDKCRDYVFNHRHEMHWSMMDEHFLKRLSDWDTDLESNWCGSGAMPALSISGKIYPCFRWLPHTQEDESRAEAYCVGDVWNGFNNKDSFRKVREATRAKISPPECLECEYEPCCAYCLTPDTPIFMADFTTKPIKDVKAGDIVIAFDETAAGSKGKRKYQFAEVEKIFSREVDEELYYINDSKHGITGEHPVLTMDNTDSVFLPINEIKNRGSRIFINDLPLLKEDEKEFLSVFTVRNAAPVEIREKHYKGTVYNLKTSSRTYIADNVLVHNCIGGCYSEFGCFKRTIHICEITKILARKAEEYWKMYDKAEGTNHFMK